MNKSALSAVALFALAFSAHDAFAVAIPYHDYFNGLKTTELLKAPPGWVSDNGTVDWVARVNPYGITCFHNSKGCVDLDGAGKAGLFETSGTFKLKPGQTYELSAEVSGNQRGQTPPDTLEFGFLKGTTNFLAGATKTISGIASSSPFTLYTLFYTNTSATTQTVRAFFEDVGGDTNIGPILDHVNIADVKAVPLPAAAWLLLSGLGALGAFARRRIGGPQRLAA